jgi:hypothetical protein
MNVIWPLLIILFATVIIPSPFYVAFATQFVKADREHKSGRIVSARKHFAISVVAIVATFAYIVFGSGPAMVWADGKFSPIYRYAPTMLQAHTPLRTGDTLNAAVIASPETHFDDTSAFEVYANVSGPLRRGKCTINSDDYTLALAGAGVTVSPPAERNDFPASAATTCSVAWAWSATAAHAGRFDLRVSLQTHVKGRSLYTWAPIAVTITHTPSMDEQFGWFQAFALIIVSAGTTTLFNRFGTGVVKKSRILGPGED